MIENLQRELWELERKKCCKNFFKVFERQNMQNQAIFELYMLMI